MCLQCPICFEMLCSGPAYSIECGHTFHLKCLSGMTRNAPNGCHSPCPVCRKSAIGFRKLYVDQEICNNGVEFDRMRKQLIEYQEKAAEQAAEMQVLKIASASLSSQNAQLRLDYNEMDFDWRQKYGQLETKSRLPPQADEVKPVLQATARLPPKSVAFTTADSNQNIFGPKNRNIQRDESELENKLSQLEKELRDSREQFRREKDELNKKLEIELGKRLKKNRGEPKSDTKRIDDSPPRRKYPVRECRSRAGTYKD